MQKTSALFLSVVASLALIPSLILAGYIEAIKTCYALVKHSGTLACESSSSFNVHPSTAISISPLW